MSFAVVIRCSRWWEQLRQDFAYAWRGLGRNPGFAAAVLLTLAIGIGACTAMFSVVRAVWLRPLPYHEPDRLVTVWSEVPRRGISQAGSGYADIEDWRRSSRTLRALTAFDPGSIIITDPQGGARRASGAFVSASMFDALGVPPLLGRVFTDEECARGDGVALLSHQAWQQYYGGDPDVIGRSLVVNHRPIQIIGVMPAGFYFPQKNDELWLPETLEKEWMQRREGRGTGAWRVIARLADGVTLDEAEAEFTGIAAVLARAHPETNEGLGLRLVPLSLQVTGRSLRLALLVLAAAVTAVLLIACSNVANLLLARGAARQREFAVREALGAGRGRLVRQLLAECTLLSLLAAVFGAALAWAALQGVRTLGSMPRLEEIRLDPMALGFAVLAALVSAVASGLRPALRSVRVDPMSVLRGGRGLSEGGASRRWRDSLVAAEFALAIMLLIAASLLVRSFVRLTAVDLGFRTERVLVVGMTYPAERPAQQAQSYASRVLERIRALPGVVAAGISEEVLLSEIFEQVVSVEGARATDNDTRRLPMRSDTITPGYFEALRAPLRLGRNFTEQDGSTAPRVVIVNETFARRFWPGENPVGRRLRNGGPDSAEPWATVVGVVGDLRRQGPEHAPVPQTFWPLAQRPTWPMNLVVATTGELAALAPAVRAVLAEIDRSVPISVSTLHEGLERKLALREFNLGLIGAFATIALTLAGIGIFGLMNYSVARRTQEIGIRVALGATPEAVLRMILGDGLKLALIGTALGAGLSIVLMRGLAGLLYATSPLDPVAFVGAVTALVVIALLACYLPARRALGVNPVVALRAE